MMSHKLFVYAPFSVPTAIDEFYDQKKIIKLTHWFIFWLKKIQNNFKYLNYNFSIILKVDKLFENIRIIASDSVCYGNIITIYKFRSSKLNFVANRRNMVS